jgi:methylmalonyl-CoA mutase C-terminal domain/subunit
MLPSNHRIRILIAKVGLDGHDVGARIIARGLADAGMEVIYTGIRQTPEQVVGAAMQEDVDAIGISLLSGTHLHYVPYVARLLDEKGMDDVLLIVGGVIPQQDIPKLLSVGVVKVFLADASIDSVVQFLREQLPRRNVQPAME